jgi:dTDP-4-amino-4,6-dideoxygalactose transaminase
LIFSDDPLILKNLAVKKDLVKYKNNLIFAGDFFLEENNIQTRVTFAGNVTRHPIYREYLQEFTNSDTIMENGFLLGAHHGMTLEDVDYVCDKIKEYFNK